MEGGHKAVTLNGGIGEGLVTPENLRELRLSLAESFRVFGFTLKNAIYPQSKRGFSKPYVIALEQGKRPITPEISTAFQRIAAAHDDVDPTTATAITATVYATENIGGALVTGCAVECARPGCKVRFVKTNPAQKYHSKWCRNQMKRG